MKNKEIEKIKNERKDSVTLISHDYDELKSLAKIMGLSDNARPKDIIRKAATYENGALFDSAYELACSIEFERGIAAMCGIVLIEIAHTH